MPTEITNILMDNLEVIIVTGGFVVAALLFMPRVLRKQSNNDLTELIVKHNKRKDIINKQTKSIF